jgi:hypothetical protein
MMLDLSQASILVLEHLEPLHLTELQVRPLACIGNMLQWPARKNALAQFLAGFVMRS